MSWIERKGERIRFESRETPNDLVKYIVEQCVDPLLREAIVG
jgi:hypothetical protein